MAPDNHTTITGNLAADPNCASPATASPSPTCAWRSPSASRTATAPGATSFHKVTVWCDQASTSPTRCTPPGWAAVTPGPGQDGGGAAGALLDEARPFPIQVQHFRPVGRDPQAPCRSRHPPRGRGRPGRSWPTGTRRDAAPGTGPAPTARRPNPVPHPAPSSRTRGRILPGTPNVQPAPTARTISQGRLTGCRWPRAPAVTPLPRRVSGRGAPASQGAWLPRRSGGHTRAVRYPVGAGDPRCPRSSTCP
jgi:hypothetical protein